MDIFRNIENDTFGYGGITAKQDKVNYAVSEREDRVTDVATIKE